VCHFLVPTRFARCERSNQHPDVLAANYVVVDRTLGRLLESVKVGIPKVGVVAPRNLLKARVKGQLNQGLWRIGRAFYALSQFQANLPSA